MQEQVLAELAMQQTKRYAKNLIRRHLSDHPGTTLRVGVESHAGRHRSVAMVEELGNECSEFAFVTNMHICACISGIQRTRSVRLMTVRLQKTHW